MATRRDTEVTEVERVIEELVQLRSACYELPLTASDLTKLAPTIVRVFGAKNPDAALERLAVIETDDKRRRFVEAAVISLGLGPYKGNQTDRWTEYLVNKHPTLRKKDVRTARRWCDIGFKIIAEKILNKGAREPGIAIDVDSDGEKVIFEIHAEWFLAPDTEDEAYIDVSWGSGTAELQVTHEMYELTTPELPIDQAELAVRWPEHVAPVLFITGNVSTLTTLAGNELSVGVEQAPGEA